jgi:hypothetical protein
MAGLSKSPDSGYGCGGLNDYWDGYFDGCGMGDVEGCGYGCGENVPGSGHWGDGSGDGDGGGYAYGCDVDGPPGCGHGDKSTYGKDDDDGDNDGSGDATGYGKGMGKDAGYGHVAGRAEGQLKGDEVPDLEDPPIAELLKFLRGRIARRINLERMEAPELIIADVQRHIEECCAALRARGASEDEIGHMFLFAAIFD